MSDDPGSVLCFLFVCLFLRGRRADLRSVSELQITQYVTSWEAYKEQNNEGRGDGLEERHTVRQASRRTDRLTEHSYGEEQSAKWSFSTYSHGLVVDAVSVISHLNAQRIKGVVWQERVSEGWGCEASVESFWGK